MPAPARKPAAKKAPGAVAARREVRREKRPAATITVPFRGTRFDIPVDRLGAYYMRGAYMVEYGVTAEQVVKSLFRILGQVDSARFLDLMTEGDTIFEVAGEFTRALNKAGNVPNS